MHYHMETDKELMDRNHHVLTLVDIPLRKDACVKMDKGKMANIEKPFGGTLEYGEKFAGTQLRNGFYQLISKS